MRRMDDQQRRRYLSALELTAYVPRAAGRVDEVDRLDADPPPAQEPGVQVKDAEAIAVPSRADPAPRATADSWPELAAEVADCRRCRLCETRQNTVFGVGPQEAELLVVGEGPGADEDARGEPFVGRAGKLLDEMLMAIGRSRDPARGGVYIANVVKCRPPQNREPQPDEVDACRDYLDRQIALLRPRLIVALGRVAAQRLLATDQPLSRLRGSEQRYGNQDVPVLVTYHPAYLLRSPREKRKAWEDLKVVSRRLVELGSA
jgi:uracil-DNA glycosylase, family 4